MLREVTTFYLEQTAASELRPASPAVPPLRVIRAEEPSPPFNRFLYTAVGGDWYWIDRLSWSYAHWHAYLDRPELTTWVGYVRGTPAGYFELEQQDEAVEIAYFGLLPQFIGRGLGGALLSAALRHSWELHPRRVWVHTCTLDGPAALANYQARGMRLYHQETALVEVAEQPPGLWPGARPQEA